MAFKFKGNQGIEKGQYRIPFIAKLPQRLPGSFILKPNDDAEDNKLEEISIKYFIEVYI